MNKLILQTVLSRPYDQFSWKQVLMEVFGVKRILQTPQPIYLSNTQKVSEAYELGSFSTKDDRIIGIYQVNVNPEVWLERNKVGLRTLLRDVYKYDVDGAIIVFVQENKWRLSFVSEIKTLNEKGEIQTQATEPRRYTYLLGEGEKILTPAQNLAKIAGKPLTLEDIRNAFSVEALNEEFYKIIAQQFYELVGATAGKGKNIRTYERKLQLPSTSDAKTYQEFAVRLIGRTIFCWFLKVKKSDSGLSLLPEHLLESAAVSQFSNYYHTVLERIFFQTLNTPMEKRLSDLPTGANQIPFLNGGLFDYQEDDFYIPNKITGLSENINTLIIPDQWFLSFFQELEKYNFTIDENSTVDIEVSVDPEMLGRIFENLLAEIDPDSGETARKATGSFYTPREIVDYMATESLVHYLHNKTAVEKESLSMLFKIDSQIQEDSALITQKVAILEALDSLKILDPACGSGAFPMGVLQKIVMALQKIDPNSEWWKNKQIEKNDNPVLRSIIREKLNAASVEYARKIGIIQNTLYGIDIQPIAAEISKLRCFLTLIVDENIDENKPNRGVEPLPNLEFKFVTADSLRTLPLETNYGGLFNSNDDLEQLKRIRQDYLQSFGEEKAILKSKFKQIQDRVAQQQFSLGKNIDTDSRAYLIGTWKPFSHEKVDWFDPEWMFGIKRFDIVIGNPPYVKESTNKNAFLSVKKGIYYQGKMDLWYYFACLFIDYLTKDNGVLSFIATNNWVTNAGASILRNKILSDANIITLLDFNNFKVFKSAEIQTMIMLFERPQKISEYISFDYKKVFSETISRNELNNFLSNTSFENVKTFKLQLKRETLLNKVFTFNASKEELLLNRISQNANFYIDGKEELMSGIDVLQDFVNKKSLEILGNGYSIGDGIFVISNEEKDRLNLDEYESELLKPYYTTEQLGRYYGVNKNEYWIIYTDSKFKDFSKINSYVNIKKHLDRYLDIMTSDNKPYGLHRARDNYFFTGEKIFSLRKCSKPTFTYTNFDCYVSRAFFSIKTNRINQKYLTALLNSSVIRYWLFKKGKMQGVQFQIDKDPILSIPIISQSVTNPFINLVDYILFLNSFAKEQSINEFVPNSHIVQIFEEVIDGMVYELYFKDDFEAVNIEFIKYAERDFRSIEGVEDEAEKIKIIHEAYQKLREKDNEIRNNLKLMLIELKDLLTPIITAK